MADWQTSFSEDYLILLKRLDYLNFSLIIILGVATFPLAGVVYYRLLTRRLFRHNYTFRLIVVAGAVDFIVFLWDIIFLQCTTYSAFNPFYEWLNSSGLAPLTNSGFYAICILQILLSLSVAVNRLLFIVRRRLLQLHSRRLFYGSVFGSIVLSVVCGACLHQKRFSFIYIYVGFGMYAHSPSSGELPSYIGMVLLIGAMASLVLFVSILVAKSIFSYRRQLAISHGANVESGLIIVALWNFANYILFMTATIIGTYTENLFLCYSICLFITIGCVSPFWCLFIFGKSMRRNLFTTSCVKLNQIPSISSSSRS